MTAPRRAERDPAAAAGAAGRPRAARAAWSPGSGARGPGPAAVPASRCTFSPGGGATCGSVRPNMATRSSRRESRLPFLFTLVALLPPGALCAMWTQTLHGGRAPLPQDRGFRVVQGEPRELWLWARGGPRGADEKPLRRRRSAALQQEPVKVYGQVSDRPRAFLGSFLSPRFLIPASILCGRLPGAGTAGDFPACICVSPPRTSTTVSP